MLVPGVWLPPGSRQNNMLKIGLVVDEGTDLPREIIKKHNISVVPFKIDWPEGEDLPGENIYQKMKEGERKGMKTFVKTSQPSPKDFLEVFKKQLGKFENILCITITSKLSGTYNSAFQAKNFLEEKLQKRISLIDSLNASAGEGLLVVKAIRLIQQGIKIGEIVEELKEAVPKIHLIGMLEDPKWLEASGRLLHPFAVWVRQMQRVGIRPLLGVKKGKIRPIGIKTGVQNMSTALFKEFEAKTLTLKKRGENIKVAITHADNFKEAEALKEMVEGKMKNVEIIFFNLISSVLGGIVGPGTLVLAWEIN